MPLQHHHAERYPPVAERLRFGKGSRQRGSAAFAAKVARSWRRSIATAAARSEGSDSNTPEVSAARRHSAALQCSKGAQSQKDVQSSSLHVSYPALTYTRGRQSPGRSTSAAAAVAKRGVKPENRMEGRRPAAKRHTSMRRWHGTQGDSHERGWRSRTWIKTSNAPMPSATANAARHVLKTAEQEEGEKKTEKDRGCSGIPLRC